MTTSYRKNGLRILHTSDWHLGRRLYGRKRYEEFEAFIDWLVQVIDRGGVDVVVIAGDVFDTTTPGNRAQGLYFDFLSRAGRAGCRHVVVIGGNHDSPSLLDAPRRLLKGFNIYVIGAARETAEEEVIVLNNPDGEPELIICAVPYLRDRDVRTSTPGESDQDRNTNLLTGIRNHYRAVVDEAERLRDGRSIPLVATGHLFAAGGKTQDGDGVRELYVGSLVNIPADIFPDSLDCVALGHLHSAQRVAGRETIRYSGAALPMGFGEAGRAKSLYVVDFTGRKAQVRLEAIPVFQDLERVSGDWEAIAARIEVLKDEKSSAWLEVVYDGREVMADLNQRLEEAVNGSNLEIRRRIDNRIRDQVLGRIDDQTGLDQLNEEDVFARCLDDNEVPEEQRPELIRTYRETLAALQEDDPRAE